LTAAAALTGAELVELVQSGANVKSTAQDIADLASAGAAVWGSITGTLSSQTDLNSALAGKQAIDTDLTTIAGLTPSNDDIMQYKAGAWANRTVAQIVADLTAINAASIADGSVSNAEFQYLNGVTSAIQTQLDAKVDENGAIVGATDIESATALLTRTMNAYGLVTDNSATNTANAERVMAAMFATVQNGDINMQALSDNLGKVASTASAAGVPIETIGAAVAALTGAGIGVTARK